MTGHINYLANGPVTWQSKTEASLALAKMAAEYMALAVKVQEGEMHWMVHEEVGLPVV